MARGSFDDDFTSKWGFNDGASSEGRDFLARDGIVRGLNKLLTKTVAVPFDRAGMHNACLILFFNRKDGLSPEQYLEASDEEECRAAEAIAMTELSELPPDKDGCDFEMWELVNEVYDELGDDVPPEEVCGENIVAKFVAGTPTD